MKRSALVVALVVALCVGSALIAGSASAQGYGAGLDRHSEFGYRGAARNYTYGGLQAKRIYMQPSIFVRVSGLRDANSAFRHAKPQQCDVVHLTDERPRLSRRQLLSRHGIPRRRGHYQRRPTVCTS